MSFRPFLDEANRPTEKGMEEALGSAYDNYRILIGLTNSFSQDWSFASSSGWILKISDRKKSLLYLIPLKDGFKVSMTIRESEREALLRDDELRKLKEKILSSKKHMEGFAFEFEIFNNNDFPSAELFVKKLIKLRV
jgi:hypothetical protein